MGIIILFIFLLIRKMDLNNTEKMKKYALVAAGFIALAASIWYIN